MLKTIILDDESPAIALLSAYVEKVPFLELVLATTNPFEVISLINNQAIDLLLSDIEMPDITGIELLKSIKKPPMVIFTTAYEQYAVQGFDLDIVDYLVKPIPFNRFLKGVNKAQKWQQQNEPVILPTTQPFLYVKADYQTVKIAFEDLLYIEGLKDYVKIYTTTKMVMTRLNLKGIAAKLPRDQFIRVHRSYIAAFAKITAFQKSHIMIGQKEIPVGNTYQAELFKRLG